MLSLGYVNRPPPPPPPSGVRDNSPRTQGSGAVAGRPAVAAGCADGTTGRVTRLSRLRHRKEEDDEHQVGGLDLRVLARDHGDDAQDAAAQANELPVEVLIQVYRVGVGVRLRASARGWVWVWVWVSIGVRVRVRVRRAAQPLVRKPYVSRVAVCCSGERDCFMRRV